MDLERQKFEAEIANALRDAEATSNPSESVWSGIELALEKERTAVLQRRLVYLRYAVAASVALVLLFAGWNFSLIRERNSPVMASKGKNSNAIKESPKDILQPTTEMEIPVDQESTTTIFNSKVRANTVALSVADLPGDSIETPGNSRILLNNPAIERSLPQLVNLKRVKPVFNPTGDPVAAMFAKLAALESALAGEKEDKEKRSASERLWTSIGFSSGSFTNPYASNITSASNSGLSYYNKNTVSPTASRGNTVGMGLQFGYGISSNWVLTTGLGIQTMAQEYEAFDVTGIASMESVRVDAFYSPIIANSQAPVLAASLPYKVNDMVTYLTIPLQIGYQVKAGKFGMVVNTGLASDFFIRNSLQASDSKVPNEVIGASDNTRYDNVVFAGLAGAEFSYRIGTNYRIAVNPGLRYPLQSIFSEGTALQSQPVYLNLGLNLKYLFK